MNKDAKKAGADQLTPSVPQYFSWINSTNEGSTEAQTLVNLDYFQYMRDTYGMQIKLYAWDAGNFDGARLGYGDVNSEKFKSQYPNGYKNVVEKAKSIGVRMGLWGSPDGFGDDPDTEKKRYDFFVHLCRDYHWGLFKLDGVCGQLRPEKAALFAQMLQDCRKYSPDLVVLNHRLPLYEAEPYVTTYLWNGIESYTDVCFAPAGKTALHNRAYMFERGFTDNLDRLAEDHGVCISSSIDYFEDELIYQAFGRSLILAPEIYGNPWFLKDSEQPRLARIYNYHRRNASILVQGKRLGAEYGANAIARGTDNKRIITTGNDSWDVKTITLHIDESLGLTEKGNYEVILRHPYEEHLGTFAYGDTVDVTLNPFRACLIEVSAPRVADPFVKGMAYRVVREDENGELLEFKKYRDEKTDVREKAPVHLGALNDVLPADADAEFKYETAMFAISNDSLEYRSLLRAGKTTVPQIQAARDAFFAQKVYALRGCENRNMFDGREDTFFDAQSRCYCDSDLRVDGGCLRVDFGQAVDCDRIEIVSFKGNETTREVLPLLTPAHGFYSADMHTWIQTGEAEVQTLCSYTQEVVRFTVHDIYDCPGEKVKTSYAVGGTLRYFRLPVPMDRIYSVKALKNGVDVTPRGAFANNMQAPYEERPTKFEKSMTVTLPEYREGARIAIAVNGEHGVEGVYAVMLADGRYVGFDARATAYPANVWEHRVCATNANNTLFLTLPADLAGKTVTLTALFNGTDDTAIDVQAYLCDRHD